MIIELLQHRQHFPCSAHKSSVRCAYQHISVDSRTRQGRPLPTLISFHPPPNFRLRQIKPCSANGFRCCLTLLIAITVLRLYYLSQATTNTFRPSTTTTWYRCSEDFGCGRWSLPLEHSQCRQPTHLEAVGERSASVACCCFIQLLGKCLLSHFCRLRLLWLRYICIIFIQILLYLVEASHLFRHPISGKLADTPGSWTDRGCCIIVSLYSHSPSLSNHHHGPCKPSCNRKRKPPLPLDRLIQTH